MKNPKASIFSVILLACIPAHAQKSDPVEGARKKSIAELDKKYAVALKRINDEAVVKYEELLKAYTRAGNLDKAIATHNKIAALTGKEPIAMPEVEPPSTPGLASHGTAGDAGAPGKEPGIPGGSDSPRSTGPPDAFPKGTTRFGNNHYYMLTEAMDFPASVEACRKLGGHVLSLDSEAEYAHFHEFVSRTGKRVWLDLSDEREEGNWRNWRGEKARFLKWHEGEPNGGENQNHIQIGYQGNWHMRDVSADYRGFVICEWEGGEKAPTKVEIKPLLKKPVRRGGDAAPRQTPVPARESATPPVRVRMRMRMPVPAPRREGAPPARVDGDRSPER